MIRYWTSLKWTAGRGFLGGALRLRDELDLAFVPATDSMPTAARALCQHPHRRGRHRGMEAVSSGSGYGGPVFGVVRTPRFSCSSSCRRLRTDAWSVSRHGVRARPWNTTSATVYIAGRMQTVVAIVDRREKYGWLERTKSGSIPIAVLCC